MLSNPCPVSSGGNSAVVSYSTPSRSRIVLRYSTRLRRRTVTRPGSGSTGSIPKAPDLIHRSRASPSSADGRGLPAGGMMPDRTFRKTPSQRSRSRRRAGWASRSPRSTPPFLIPLAWQPEQYASRIGWTVSPNSSEARSAAAATPGIGTRVAARTASAGQVGRLRGGVRIEGTGMGGSVGISIRAVVRRESHESDDRPGGVITVAGRPPSRSRGAWWADASTGSSGNRSREVPEIVPDPDLSMQGHPVPAPGVGPTLLTSRISGGARPGHPIDATHGGRLLVPAFPRGHHRGCAVPHRIIFVE